MISLRWDSGVLRSLGQALSAVLIATSFVLFTPSLQQAQASGILADGSNSVIDYSIDFSGNSYAENTGQVVPATDDFTVEAWIKPASFKDWSHIVDQGHAGVSGIAYLKLNAAGQLVTYVQGTGNSELFCGSVVLNAWNHVAMTVEGGTLRCYLNGAQRGSSAITNGTLGLGFRVGAYRSDSYSHKFDGEIDQVKVWNAALSATELESSMHALGSTTLSGGNVAASATLLAHYDFNEDSGSTVHDRVGSAHLITAITPERRDLKKVNSVVGGDTVVTFPRTYLPGVGGWTVPKGVTSAVALIVGGGGAGGSTYDAIGAGGGGAGGFIESEVQLTPGTRLAVQVGQGGSKQTIPVSGYLQSHGRSGQSSTFSNLTAFGGGGGSGRSGQGLPGGSGGGTGGRNSFTGGQPFDPNQGNAGGGSTNNSTTATGGGGGGGATSAGQSVPLSTRTNGGAGGAGASSVVMSGTFAEGGSGGSAATILAGLDGDANTGNGGSGASASQTNPVNGVEGVSGGSGGSGVVAVRYASVVDNSAEFGESASVPGDYIGTSSSIVPAGAFTVEAWINPNLSNLPASGASVFSQGVGANVSVNRVFLWVNNEGKLIAGLGNVYYSTTDINASVPNAAWTHVAFTKDASNVPRIYVNSQLVWQGSANSGTYPNDFWIGDWKADNNRDFDGFIDQVKVWSTALEAANLEKSMHTYSTSGVSVAANLVAHFDMNEADGPLELDRSGNGNHLTRNAIAAGAFTSSSIVETGSASSQDVYIKFNRSYLTATGGWSRPSGVGRVTALVVGGGGSGGTVDYGASGGGGGGRVQESELNLATSPTLQVTVGAGGQPTPTAAVRAGTLTSGDGGASSVILPDASGITSLGGGGGANSRAYNSTQGVGSTTGWTGGGGGVHASSAGSGSIGAGGASFKGGNAIYVVGGAQNAGGGGGSGGVGLDATSSSGGAGGNGVESTIIVGSTFYGGGGGGGSRFTGGTAGLASQGGGGNGGAGTAGSPGGANTGGGGGGSGSDPEAPRLGAPGGSGVVILSYSLAPEAPTSLTATQSTSHATINLNWTAPGYTGNSAITDYDIEYKPAGGSWTSYSDGVSAATTRAVQLPQQCIAHEFRVIAKNSSFQSVASATASATPVWGTYGSLTGVLISSTNSECVVQFTSTVSNTWTPPSGTDTVQALVVAGGGGGGGTHGGGGGAGGLAYSLAYPVSGTLNVRVGAGGEGSSVSGVATCDPKVAYRGGDSTFGSIQVAGGGAGSNGCGGTQDTDGGSGGGDSYVYTVNNNRGEASVSPSTQTVTYLGSDGGFGLRVDGDTYLHLGGGGGGAGGAGSDPVGLAAGAGGAGYKSTISGTLACYAAGGGGGSGTSQAGSTGGIGGACAGLSSPAGAGGRGTTAGGDAVLNTGSGGGGGGYTDTRPDLAYPAGDGSSGIVIVRQLSLVGPTILTQPLDTSAEPGQTKTLTVVASGNGTLSYQWQLSTDGTNWSNVGTDSPNFTTPTLTLSDNGNQYRVMVTNSLNGKSNVATSSVAVVSVVGTTIGSGLCQTMVSNDTGVTISETAAGGCLLEFTSPGNNLWFVPANVSSVEALVVGGGGGGASGRGDGYDWYGGGAGGGGGEYTKVTLDVTTSQQIPLVVGAGGAAGGASARGALPNPGGQGGNSSFSVSGAVALGGSGGQGSTVLGVGGSGGAGGSGTGVAGSSGGDGSDGLAWRSYERPTDGGAAKLTTLGGEQYCLGGGGGGGNRGAGATHFYYQAQGGDCSSAGLGSGGDGNYFNGSNYVFAGEGVANTGGGGGGGSYNSGAGFAGATGGSGLVALYYVPGAGAVSLSQPNAMSYSSTANTTSITLTKTSPGNASWTTSNQTVCTVSGDNTGATVTVLIAGVCAVSVTVAASGGFSTGSAEVSFRIDKITQAAPGWDSATATVAFGGTLDLYEKLASPSGIANYSFTATGTGCAVTGVMLTVGNAGSNCSVTPTVNSTDKYLPATGTSLTVSVTKISQSALVLTSATSMNVDQTLTLSAAGGFGTGALSYHVASQGATGCLVNSSTGALTATAAGSCEVYAKRALSTNYDEVTSSHVVITVNKISQNLSWVSQPQAQYVAGNTYALEATASSQLTVAYSISAGLCTLAGTTVTFTGSGDCVIHAGQSGNSSYLEAVTISQTVSVGKINQTMTFSALANKSWGSLAFSLSATASSALAITYTENNQTTNDACDVSTNGIVTIKNVGTCAITATQAGNSAYTSVTTTRLFNVTANQAGAPFIGSVSFGDRQLNASFFTPSYLGGGTVSAYELRAYELDGTLASTNTGCISQPGSNQSCSVIGLTNGVTYVLKVAAITQAGLGQLSASSSEVTPASNPEAVGNLVAFEGNAQLTITWTPPTSLGGGTFDQYRIFWRAPGANYQANGSPGGTVGNQASTSFVITGLTNGVAYDVKVTTVTSVNTLELQSNTAEVRQTPFTVPDAPAAVVALDNDNNVVVAWQPPVFDGGNPIDQYVVEKDGTAVCTITSATTTSCEVTKPSPGTTSVIEVRAGNDAGLSPAASTSITVQALATDPPLIIGGGIPGISPSTPAPIVIDVSGSAVVKTNELVRLAGTNFNLVDRVLIGNIEASFFVNSAQLITIRIPIDAAAGKPTITLQGAFGSRIFTGLIEINVTQVSVDTKVTIGTFLGYAAVYTKNHEGERLSMKIGNKWRVIDPLGANYTYNLTKVGVGRTVTVEVYIDRVLVQVKQIKIQ